jgi:ATP adenylyltransferase
LNKIWAPWRIKYITQKKRKGCIFCKAYKGNQDKKNFIIIRSSYCFAMLNTFPYNNGHIMVISNRHIASLEKLKKEEILDINITAINILAILKKVMHPQGFNLGINLGKISGAGIDKHFHLHIVPRWTGDTNFMPILTDTKIISQSLKELYDKIKKCLLEKI